MKKLLFILPLLYYSCTDDIVSDINTLQDENQALQEYIDSLNTVQEIADSLNNLAIQADIDSLINAGVLSDSIYQSYIDSLIYEGILSDSLYQSYIDSLITIQNTLFNLFTSM